MKGDSFARLPPYRFAHPATLAANFTGPELMTESLSVSVRRQLTPSNARILAIQLFLDFVDQFIGRDGKMYQPFRYRRLGRGGCAFNIASSVIIHRIRQIDQ